MAAPGTRLFIGNLSWNTTDESLRTAFEDGVGGGAGSVTDAKVITDRYTGRSRYVRWRGKLVTRLATVREESGAARVRNGRDVDVGRESGEREVGGSGG